MAHTSSPRTRMIIIISMRNFECICVCSTQTAGIKPTIHRIAAIPSNQIFCHHNFNILLIRSSELNVLTDTTSVEIELTSSVWRMRLRTLCHIPDSWIIKNSH